MIQLWNWETRVRRRWSRRFDDSPSVMVGFIFCIISRNKIQLQQSNNFICIIVQQHILNLTTLAMSTHLDKFEEGIADIWPYLNKKSIAWFVLGLAFFGPALILVQSAFRQGKQEKSHGAAVHSSGHIHLTTQRAHFEGDILCVVWHAAQAKKIYCVWVYSGCFGWYSCS